MRLFPERMAKVCLFVHQSDVGKLIDDLSEKGIIHITSVGVEDISRDIQVDASISMLTPYENRLKRIVSILKPHAKRVSGIRAILNPPRVEKIRVRRKNLEELLESVEKKLQGVEEQVLGIDADIKSLDERFKANDALISKLSNIRFLDVDLGYVRGSEHIILKAGICKDVEIIKEKVESIGGIFDCRPLGRKEKKWVVVGVFHRSVADDAERIWQRYVEEIEIPDLSGTPSQIIDKLKKENNKILRDINKLKKQLKQIADSKLIEILATLEELSIEKLKLQARKSFGKTEQVYLVEGWVLKEKVDELLATVRRTTDGKFAHLVHDNPDVSEEPPTYIKAGKITKPFKPLLTLYGLPKYREINPLLFLTIWFPIMFGFMLGDAGYGLILFLGSVFAKLKFGKRSKLIREWSVIGALLGFWTIIFGYASNSFFGDLLPRFFHTQLPKINIAGVEIPVDGLRNPLLFLQIALILGLIHLNLGFALGIYQDFKNKKIKNLLCGKVSFILLQIFGGALIGENLLKIWELSPAFRTISYIGVLVGIVLLALEAKGMAFLDLMGFVGDWLSYARLLALGLATAGMALAFNIVAQLFGKMIHVAVSVLILLIAHLATMGLNSLGAAVHSLRLQYVEFFNRFYEGGGREFAPLKAKRRYTELV
ncbi:MAG: hypothetical protein DRN19_00570 [Thermoplasmata archaeon]|nr:MAG: hypothetical protein DRN19_00570 [Thermoplasmata archaeon]